MESFSSIRPFVSRKINSGYCMKMIRVIQAKLKNGDAIEYDLLTTQVRTSNADNLLKNCRDPRKRISSCCNGSQGLI